MDAIDNLIYTTRNQSLYPNLNASLNLESDYLVGGTNILNESAGLLVNLYPTVTTQPVNGISSYTQNTRLNYVIFDDSSVIEDAFKKHWYDIANRISYTSQFGQVPPPGFVNPGQENVEGLANRVFVDFAVPPYHLIFAYLVENTRIAQIFEKLIWMYQHDEKLLKANDFDAFRWIQNTENIFYKDVPGSNISITSYIRPISEASRRNAYQRMFGMDLAFGDLNNNNFPYIKAEFANSPFISLFESFLVEIWQGHTNANNTSGQNSTDLLHIERIATRLQEMLMLRRTSVLNFNNYQYFNLSREEYSSFVFMYWLFFVISTDTPLVNYLNCNANTAGERLINIGKKVNLPAHSKSVALLDIALPMNALLRLIETGLLNNANLINRILRSRSVINPVIPAPTAQEITIMDNLLLILNNWERATGHKIKQPQPSVNATIKVQQSGVEHNGVGAKTQQPVMN